MSQVDPVQGFANDLGTGVHPSKNEIPDVRRRVEIVIIHLGQEFSLGPCARGRESVAQGLLG